MNNTEDRTEMGQSKHNSVSSIHNSCRRAPWSVVWDLAITIRRLSPPRVFPCAMEMIPAISWRLQISPTCRFHPVSLLSEFTNLQISPTARFHPVSLWSHQQLSTTLDTCGLHPKYLNTRDSKGNIYDRKDNPWAFVIGYPPCFALWFHPLVDFKYLKISPTCRFHLLVDFTHFQISPTFRFHLLVYFTHLQISPTCRFHSLADFTQW